TTLASGLVLLSLVSDERSEARFLVLPWSSALRVAASTGARSSPTIRQAISANELWALKGPCAVVLCLFILTSFECLIRLFHPAGCARVDTGRFFPAAAYERRS